MNDPDAVTNNTAESGAFVGIQAEHVHNSTVYQVLPGASPRDKYGVGVHFLEDGVPTRAIDLIGEAIANGYDSAEVRFHWMLAMLSKRAYGDLSSDDRESLAHASDDLQKYVDDEWKSALRVVCELLGLPNGSGHGSGAAMGKLASLRTEQREKIVRHLDLVLTGGMKDRLWAGTRQAAKDAQNDGDRLERAWVYFHPEPIDPRVRRPAADHTTAGDRVRAGALSVIFVAAVGYLGWLVLRHATPAPIVAYLLAVAAGYLVARNGFQWRYRNARRRLKERDYLDQGGMSRAPEGGFASRVDGAFNYYFQTYVPTGTDRAVWLAATAGIRATLRDEVVELYRESRVPADRVNWLIRDLVSGVRRRWQAGTLWDHRERYRTRSATKVSCVASMVALVIAAVGVVVAAIQTSPFSAALVTLIALASGRYAAARWLRIASERRRFAEESQESAQLCAHRQAVYDTWKAKLDSKRPVESEMETWLNCDKTMVLDQALRHYRLAWRDVIAHAFLQTPARSYKRARVRGGPWRYSNYDIRLFLITKDGVREVSTELDFPKAKLSSRERNNYRFDVVSSVHVATTNQLSHTMRLTLTNGPTREIRVTDPVRWQPDSDETPDTFSKINLDAAGFAHTLHILEAIAAEGKGWIHTHRGPAGDRRNPPAA